jgi:hypothetical protein
MRAQAGDRIENILLLYFPDLRIRRSTSQRARFVRARILKAASCLGILGSGRDSSPRIMAAPCNPKVEAREVAGLIQREPALYVRVLRVANSPFYGLSRSITTLDRAVVVLGLEAVRGIAAAAESLARIGHPARATEAFIAGLLHNLGIVVQMTIDPAGITAIIALRQAADVREMRTLESEQTCVGHEHCIAAIFESWQLPEALVAAVHDHHDPAAATPAHRELAAPSNLGATLGLATGHTFTLEPSAPPRNEFAMACLGYDDAQLDGIAEEVPRRVDELGKALLDG